MRQALFGRLNAPSAKAILRHAAFAIAVIGSAASVQARSSNPLRSTVELVARTKPAKPIQAWTQFCLEQPSECAVDLSEPATINLTAQVWQTLTRINRQVNAAIKPQNDIDHWGVEDRWDFAEDGYGDCEDYQLVKRRLLVAAGLSRRALLMTVVLDEDGEGHAVMMVRTDRGDFILDNKRNAVWAWNKTGYIFIKREGDDGMGWASLGGAVASPAATAGR
jgi:predicted transglutaminase-like cysteine proteinase